MRIYLKNIPVKFHRDPISNDGALDFFEQGYPNIIINNNKISDMESVSASKTSREITTVSVRSP